jgi:predicted Zn-dependent peptidase
VVRTVDAEAVNLPEALRRDLRPGAVRSELPNGLRVVTESLPDLRSVSVGFWVGTGARDEEPSLAGASHFLEHLLFKGSESRGALEIAEAVESVGGEMNAFTAHEYTAFFVRVPDQHLANAIDILSDVVWSPAFREEDLAAERQVILDEIRMREDAADDLVHDVFVSTLFPQHPLGRQVIGSVETVNALDREQIKDFHAAHYWPSNVVVAAAGRLDHETVCRMLTERAPSVPGNRGARESIPHASPISYRAVRRPTDMVHSVLGVRALSWDDPDRYALAVLNEAVGGGMSSRIFQQVREQRGLAYSVYSYRTAFADTGLFGIYTGTSAAHLPATLDVLHNELDRLVAEGGISQLELARAKGSLVGSLALGLESSASRMHRIGRSELTIGAVPSIDGIAAEIDAVTGGDVERVVDRMLAGVPRSLAVIGPVDDSVLEEHHASR